MRAGLGDEWSERDPYGPGYQLRRRADPDGAVLRGRRQLRARLRGREPGSARPARYAGGRQRAADAEPGSALSPLAAHRRRRVRGRRQRLRIRARHLAAGTLARRRSGAPLRHPGRPAACRLRARARADPRPFAGRCRAGARRQGGLRDDHDPPIAMAAPTHDSCQPGSTWTDAAGSSIWPAALASCSRRQGNSPHQFASTRRWRRS